MRVINLWGAPGSGKSTTAAGLFSYMKLRQKKVELVTEFAKDLTYEESFITLSNQFAVSGQQEHRLRRLVNHVDYVITDSPLLLGVFYASGPYKDEWFTNALFGAYNTYDNLDFFIRRVKPYATFGRSQSEEESNIIANDMQTFMDRSDIYFDIIDGGEQAAKEIYDRLFPESGI
jgi:hypothetical protein